MELTQIEFDMLRTSILTQYAHDKNNPTWTYFGLKMRTPKTKYNKDDLSFLSIYLDRVLTNAQKRAKLLEDSGNNDQIEQAKLRLEFITSTFNSIKEKIKNAERQANLDQGNLQGQGQEGPGHVGSSTEPGPTE